MEHKQVISLVYSGLVKGAKDIIELSERSLSPDNKAADVTTGCELQKVETTDVDGFDARQIAKCLHDATIFTVDYERAAALAMATVTQLSLTGAKLARVGDLYDVAVRTEGLEKRNGLLRLGEGLNVIADDEGNLLDLLDTVAASEDERRKRRGSKGRNGSKAALVLIHLDVPPAPGLRRCEHATTATHVTEGGLYRNKFSKKKVAVCIQYAPGQNGGCLHHRHGEYARRHDRYPKTRQKSDGQLFH